MNNTHRRLNNIVTFLKKNKMWCSVLAFLLSITVPLLNPEIRSWLGLDKYRQPTREITANKDVFTNISKIKNTVDKTSAKIYNYTIYENQPLFIESAQTGLSVVYQNLDGEKFVSLIISPRGIESTVHAVLTGYTEEFESSTGIYNIQILSIDYDNKKVIVQVSRKS